MSDRRRDAATATVGAGLTAGGGYLRHAGVKNLIEHQGGKEPKVHGLAILRRGTKASRKLYGTGALVGLVGAPALGIGGTHFVRGRQPVAKMGESLAARYTTRMLSGADKLAPKVTLSKDPTRIAQRTKINNSGPRRMARGFLHRTSTDATPLMRPLEELTKRDPSKPSFLQEGLKGTGEALLERKDTIQQKVPAKARAAGYATTTGAGAAGVLAARLALRGKGAGVKALASPVAGVLAGTAATPLSSRVVHHVAPGYEVTPAGVRRKKKGLKKPSSASFSHQSHPRSFQADVAKDASSRAYRAKVTAAGAVPMANYGLQPLAAGQGIKDPSHRHRAQGTQAGATIGGDVVGAAGGAHAAAWGAKRYPDTFGARAAALNGKIESARAKVGLKPKALKPAAAASTRTGKIIRAATAPLKGPYKAAAGVGALAGTLTVGNLAQQGAITHNLRHNVGKALEPVGMTRAEQRKQLQRKSRNAALSTVSGTLGLTGVGLLAAKHHPALIHRAAQLDSYAVGTAIAGGGIGGYNSLKGARIQRRDIKAQKKALGVSKGWKQAPNPGGFIRSEPTKRMLAIKQVHRDPYHKKVGHGRPMYRVQPEALYGDARVGKSMPDQSVLHAPAPLAKPVVITPPGMLKTKAYTASAVRTTPTGKLVRVKAGMR